MNHTQLKITEPGHFLCPKILTSFMYLFWFNIFFLKILGVNILLDGGGVCQCRNFWFGGLHFWWQWACDSRRAAVQMPPSRLRARVHPAVQPAAAPPQPRRAGRARQEQALPLQHLRQRVRHRVQSQNPHVQGRFIAPQPPKGKQILQSARRKINVLSLLPYFCQN